MAQTRTLSRAFNGGELTPEFFGRVDDAKYGAGLAVCGNFIPLPHGPAVNRPGTEFVRAVKDSSKRTRILPFSYSTTQTMVIEMGAGYFRFHTAAATLMDAIDPAIPYEIANDFAEADLFDIHYVQSNDVLTLTHPNYPPCELRRYGATDWRLEDIAFATLLAPPGSLSCVATVPGGTTNLQTYKYVVTSVDTTGQRKARRLRPSPPIRPITCWPRAPSIPSAGLLLPAPAITTSTRKATASTALSVRRRR